MSVNINFQYPQSGSNLCNTKKPRQLWYKSQLSVPSKRVEPRQHSLNMLLLLFFLTFSTLKAGRTSATRLYQGYGRYHHHLSVPSKRVEPLQLVNSLHG